MDWSKFIKKLELPEDFAPPASLTFVNLQAVPLTRQHLADDLTAVNASIDTIQRTRGGSWPSEELTEEFDLLDLAWHEREFRDGTSLAYVVYDADEYVGCFYLYPMGERTSLHDEILRHDVDVSWWVTTPAYQRGEYEKLFVALKGWLKQEFPFASPYFSNAVIPDVGSSEH